MACSARSGTGPAFVDTLDTDVTGLAPDLIGHGASAKPMGDYSLGAHAATLRDLLDHLGVDRVALVGHSLGGGIAMQFCYLSARVERLVLVVQRRTGTLRQPAAALGHASRAPTGSWRWPPRAGCADRAEAVGGTLRARLGLTAQRGT